MHKQADRIPSVTPEDRNAANEMDRWLTCRVAEHEADGMSKAEAVAMAMKEILSDDEIEDVQDWLQSQMSEH
ncbi:MAG: hypothetical protein WBW98_01185 [Candidatus Sulfotelmatobacter sp.]|jgi:uncharacterized protein (DUF2267 family)